MSADLVLQPRTAVSPERRSPAATTTVAEKPVAEPVDKVLRADYMPPTDGAINDYEKKFRTGNDVVVQLIGGDGPALFSIAANIVPMPAFLSATINAANAATGYLGIAADLRTNSDTLKNPAATARDKAEDWVHFAIGDLVNTTGSMIPLFTAVSPIANHPVAFGFFAGMQLVGAAMDWHKMTYDGQREGQQSALPDAHAPKRLVLDQFEQGLVKVSQMGGSYAMMSMVPGSPIHMAMELAKPLMTFGGSVGLVASLNQVKKGKELVQVYEKAKADGYETADLPQYTRHGLKTQEVPIDQAIKVAKQQVRWEKVSLLNSGLMTAAGVTGFAPLALVSTAIGLAMVGVVGGTLAYKLLPQGAQDKIAAEAKKVADFARPVTDPAVKAFKTVMHPLDVALDTAMAHTSKALSVVQQKLGVAAGKVGTFMKPVTDPINRVVMAPVGRAEQKLIDAMMNGAIAGAHGVGMAIHGVQHLLGHNAPPAEAAALPSAEEQPTP